MMTNGTITRNDPSGMRMLIAQFPAQVREAIRIGTEAGIRINSTGIRNIVVTGLGGSAIGGDLLRAFASEQMSVPFFVNRHYFLPGFVDKNSLVIVSSYSGNTEETLDAHNDAVKRGARVLCISSNGATERMAKKFRQPYIKIPGGLPPRAALAYSFFPLLITLRNAKLLKVSNADLDETLRLLTAKAEIYSGLVAAKNPALALAERIHGKLIVMYSATDRFDAVNLRWRGQFDENAKTLAFGHVIPEMNHNELVGWNVLKSQMKNLAVILLRDAKDHKRVQLRMDINKEIIGKYTDNMIEVRSEGRSLLARMFSLVHLGDWTSYYLAILNGVDPTPVKVIDYLKAELGKVK
jgi:glucose/mannose-6-phosphate isomerase